MHRPARGALRISTRLATRPPLSFALIHSRPYSLSATESPPNLQPHQYTAFERLSTALSLKQPCFGARGDEVELLTGPEVFYSRLLDMIKGAKRRILISSLYIGAEEGELVSAGYKPSSIDCWHSNQVEAIQAALTNNPQLRVVFILDYHRATRLATSTNLPPSTAHLLLPLVERFPDRCEVWLFRSPKLKGLMEKIVPARYDEGWGTWHGKWYGADDEVIISG